MIRRPPRSTRTGTLFPTRRSSDLLRFNALEFTPLEEYMQLVNINQVGCFLGMKSVTRTMRKNGGGSIINASSVEGLGGMPTLVGYSATKFADRKSTRLNSSHSCATRLPSSA